MKHRRGLWIAALGPDGAGKSAMISHLHRLLGGEFAGVDVYHFRFARCESGRTSRPVTHPHNQPPRGLLASLTKLLFLLAVFWRDFVLYIRPKVDAGRLVIFDRYFDDVLVDSLRYRLSPGCVSPAKWLSHFLPRPDLWLVLDVEARRVQERKPEVTFDESCRQAAAYREVAASLSNGVLIDANQSVENMAKAAVALVRDTRSQSASQSHSRAEEPAELAQRVFAPLRDPTPVPSPRAIRSEQTIFLAVDALQPRWLVPERCRKANVVLRDWTPHRKSSKILWLTIRAANSAGVLQLLPGIGRQKVESIEQVDWKQYGWESSDHPQPIVYVGTPGPQQKAVIHLIDAASGECTQIVKIPLGPGGHAAILHEAAVLAEVESATYPFAPRLISLDRARAVSVQTYVAGKTVRTGRVETFLPLLLSLRLDTEVTTIAEQCADYQGAYHGQPVSDSENLLRAAIGYLQDETPLPAFRVHGDFAPWNIRKLTDGSCRLIDWEDATLRGLPLQDALHYLHIQDFVFGRHARSHTRELASLAATLGVPSHLVPTLEIAYLVRQHLRRVKQRQQQHAAFLLKGLRIALANCANQQRQISVPDATAESPVSAAT